MTLFLALKLIHVLSAIVAVGSNVTYAFWLRTTDPGHRAFVIRGVRRLDRTVANPAYGLLLVTGVLMVLTGAYSFSQRWIEAAIALYEAFGFEREGFRKGHYRRSGEDVDVILMALRVG